MACSYITLECCPLCCPLIPARDGETEGESRQIALSVNAFAV
jgi:hypothetical protein